MRRADILVEGRTATRREVADAHAIEGGGSNGGGVPSRRRSVSEAVRKHSTLLPVVIGMADPATPAEVEALKLDAILKSAVAAIVTIDSRGRIEIVNPAAEEMFGYAAGELAGRNVNMLMPEPYRSQHDTYLSKYLATGRRQIIGIGREVAGLRKDGTTFPMHLSVGEFKIGERRYFTGAILDLSAQRAAEQRFEREQALFRSIFQSLPDPLVICDTAGAIRLVNPSFTKVFGFTEPEVLGESVGRLCERAENARLSLGTDTAPARFQRKSGELFPATTMQAAIVGSSGSQLGRLLLIHDATAERQQEALLLQAQRIEAVGQLTGGVAHDFNNLLTVILGNLELLEPKLVDALSQSLAGEAREAAEMGARLTDRLLTFARRQRLETESINLNEFVLGLTELLRRTIGTPIDLSTALARRFFRDRDADRAAIGHRVARVDDQVDQCEFELRLVDKQIAVGVRALPLDLHPSAECR